MIAALLPLSLAATDPRLAVLDAIRQELERGPVLPSPWQIHPALEAHP